jgi:hypothetical protein
MNITPTVAALALVAALTTPTHALPIGFDGHPWMEGCGWARVLADTGPLAPPCSTGLAIVAFLTEGEPTPLWATLAFYPDGFEGVGLAALVIQHTRLVAGGLERFSIALPQTGDYFFALALPTHGRVYFFQAEVPDVPLAASEPATLGLLGSALVAAGWAARRRGGAVRRREANRGTA